MDNNIKKYLKYGLILKVVKYAAIAAWFFLSSSFTYAQIEFSADTGKINWGERATITARLGVSAEEKTISLDSFPTWTDSIPGGLEVLEIIGPDTVDTSENDPDEWDFVIVKSWVVTAWDSGFAQLHGLQIQKVPTRTEDPNAIAQHRDIIEVDWTLEERAKQVLPYLVIVFVVLALVLGMVWAIRKLVKGRAKGVVEKPEIVLPPHVIALEKLEDMRQRKAWLKGGEKDFQVGLSRALREYIDARFFIKSLDKTSSEAVALIRNIDASEGDKQAVIQVLLMGDSIKFAKSKAPDDVHVKALNTSVEFVKNTIKRDEVG